MWEQRKCEVADMTQQPMIRLKEGRHQSAYPMVKQILFVADLYELV